MAQTNVLSALPTTKLSERPIGLILVDEGRITSDDASRILRLQSEHGLSFGEAGKKLRLLTQADIHYALLRQFDYCYLSDKASQLDPTVVAAYNPFSPQVEALRALRSQLLIRWIEADVRSKALAIMSPARQEGRSFMAANLAVVFAQLSKRTLLIDADMRSPAQHTLFGIDNRMGLSAVLAGRHSPDLLRPIQGLVNLAVLPSGVQPPNPLELLSGPSLRSLLNDLCQEYDVILIDTPPASGYADAHTIARRAGAALIVARKHISRLAQIRTTAHAAVDAGATVVGTVLNG